MSIEENFKELIIEIVCNKCNIHNEKICNRCESEGDIASIKNLIKNFKEDLEDEIECEREYDEWEKMMGEDL